MSLVQFKSLPIDDSEGFWQFSVQLYRCEGVKEYCLRLQNESELNVNFLLLSAWMNLHEVSLTEEQTRRLEQACAETQLTLNQMRFLRTNFLKNSKEYKKHLSEELRIEAEQQKIMLAELGAFRLNPSTACNVRRYLSYKSVSAETATQITKHVV